MRYLMMLMLVAGMAAFQYGCEASAEVDDDNGELEIDVDD